MINSTIEIDIIEIVNGFIRKTINEDETSLLLKQDLGLDSIKQLSLITEICKKFDIELVNENDLLDFYSVKTVKDIITCVKARV